MFVLSAKAFMEGSQRQQPSAFAQVLDRLPSKLDEELKVLYPRFFPDDLKNEWASLTSAADFGGASEEDIIKAIQEARYRQKD